MNTNITLRQLRAFRAVGHEGSFTRAAARLRLTQSALSIAVQSLEAELGLRLLDRSTRSVTPTLHGLRLLGLADRVLDELERGVEDLRAHAERARGQVAVLATTSLIRHVLAPALVMLAQRYPGISVRIQQDVTAGGVQRVLDGELDFALITLPAREPSLATAPLLSDRLGMLCHADHPLGRESGPLAWSALRHEELVGLSAGSGIRSMLATASVTRGLGRPRHEVSGIDALLGLLSAGLGVAVVPALVAQAPLEPWLRFRPLRPALHRTVILACRPGRAPTPAAGALLDVVLERLAMMTGPDIAALHSPAALSRLGFQIAA